MSDKTNFIAMRQRCETIASFIMEVLASPVFNSTFGNFAVIDCMKCGKPIKRRWPEGKQQIAAKCFECGAGYLVRDIGGAQCEWKPDVPGGTQVRMDYNGQQLSGVVSDGKWIVDGREFSSPSAAASKSVRTKSGKETSLDGWKYWQAKRPGDDGWTSIGSMRPEVQRLIADAIDGL